MEEQLIAFSILFAILSGFSKAIEDTSALSTLKGTVLNNLNWQWWHKSTSSTNKWKNADKSQGEAFLGSSTIFVWLTDAWHLFDFLRDLSLIISIACIVNVNLYLTILIVTIKQVSFELMYKYLKVT